MASALSEYQVGIVVVLRCRYPLGTNPSCNCSLLLTQMDGNDGSAQAWFHAHGKPAQIWEVGNYGRCILQFCFVDEFNIVTTWRSQATSLQYSTVLVDKDEFVQHHPHGLIFPIALLKEKELATRLSDDDYDSEIKSRERTLA